jgi:hypothetical protein
VRLEKIEDGTEVYDFEWFFDFIDCGEYYLLIVLHNKNGRVITLNQNATLKDLYEEYGGDFYYSKFCKTTFRMYTTEKGYIESRNIDEVINLTEIDPSDNLDYLILKALVTGKGLEKLNLVEHIIRWPNENGGRGEYWYRLLRN